MKKINFKAITASLLAVASVSLISGQSVLADDSEILDFSAVQTQPVERAELIGKITRILSDSPNAQMEQILKLLSGMTNEQLSQASNFSDFDSLSSYILSEAENLTPQTMLRLGDSEEDLVYTPVDPCRVVDTRKAHGVLMDEQRNYYVHGTTASTVPAQGGAAAGCSAPRGEPAAVHLNISAIPATPSSNNGKGNIQVGPKDTPLPNAVLIKYLLGSNISNAATIKTCVSCGTDIALRANGNPVHIVIDVLGYYYKVDKNDTDKLAVAFGTIKSDGSIYSSSENVTSSWNGASERYEITISGHSYYYQDYTTVASPICTNGLPRVSSVSGKLLIYIREVFGSNAGDYTQCDVNFVTYKNQ